MVTLPVTLSAPESQTTPKYIFCIAFHIIVAGEHRDFKFGVQVDHSKSQPTDDKLFLKGVWSRPLKYLCNGSNLDTSNFIHWQIVPQVGVITVTASLNFDK